MRRLARPVMYVGVAAVVLALGTYHGANIGDYDFATSSRFTWAFAYIGLLSIASYGMGLPDLIRGARASLASGVVAAGVGAMGISVVQLFVGDTLLPRFVVFSAVLILPPWYAACSALSAGGRSMDESRDRVVVVAPRADVEALRDELNGNPERPAAVVAELTVDEAVPHGSATRPLVEAVKVAAGRVVVLDRAAQAEPAIVAQAATLHEAGVRVRTLSLFYEQWLGKLPISELERVSLMFDIGEVHRLRYTRAKRIVDVMLAVAGLAPLLLLTPIVFLGNVVANRGPLLYRQERIGKGGATFSILKFRTMTPRRSGELVDQWTAEGDPRITPFGRILRTGHLDELPQVLNILRGDLSMVGPRPEQPGYVSELSEKLPFYPLRHLVRPGLTGWAQVKYGYAGSHADALEKLQYEFWYLRHQNVRTDLRIVGRTVRSVLGSEGRGR